MTVSIILVWVGFIFFAAVFFASSAIVCLFHHKKIEFDKGMGLSLSASLLALLLCLSIWPPIHRVFDDEAVYISQSVNILESGKPNIILKGSRLEPEESLSWTANKKFPGFAWLEAVTLFLTRDLKYNYFYLNIILGTLSVALVYRIAWVWSANYELAWWSAIFWACLPARITYSMSAVSDIAGVFFFLLFLLFISEYRFLRAKRILYAALFCAIYSICIKLVYGVFEILGLIVVLYIYKHEGRLDRKIPVQVVLNIVCLFLPFLCAIPFVLLYFPKDGHGFISIMSRNLYNSIAYLFNYKQNTLLTALPVLAIIGRSIFSKRDNLVNGLTGWFLVGLLLVSMFLTGGISYPGYAYSDRFFLFFAFPFVLLAAKGMVDIVTKSGFSFLGVLFFILLVVNASFASRHLDTLAKDVCYYKKILLLKQMDNIIPDKAYLIDESAALVASETSMKSIQTLLFLRGIHPAEVVYLKGIYDFTDAHRTNLVEDILSSGYLCRSLVTTPFKEAYLSATPMLCIRKEGGT